MTNAIDTNGLKLQTRSLDGAVVATSAKKRTCTAVWSDDTCDHYRTCFVPGGCDFSVFDQNRIILWNHGKESRGYLPVGNATEYGCEKYRGKNCIIGTCQWWDDEFSDYLRSVYETGKLKGWSIQALPLEGGPPTPAERSARRDWQDAELVFRRWRLLETSAAPLPGNENTLTIAVGRGLEGPAVRRMPSPDLVATLEEQERKRRGRIAPELAAELERIFNREYDRRLRAGKV